MLAHYTLTSQTSALDHRRVSPVLRRVFRARERPGLSFAFVLAHRLLWFLPSLRQARAHPSWSAVPSVARTGGLWRGWLVRHAEAGRTSHVFTP